jgi:hypothetical protein
VDGTTLADWQAVLDLVRAEGWSFESSVGGERAALPGRAEQMLDRPDQECVVLRVWPAPGVLAIFRLYAVEQVDFDVDLRELQGQEQLDVLCGFVRTLGRRLGKRVLMTPEGSSAFPLISYEVDVDQVVMLAPAWTVTSESKQGQGSSQEAPRAMAPRPHDTTRPHFGSPMTPRSRSTPPTDSTQPPAK